MSFSNDWGLNLRSELFCTFYPVVPFLPSFKCGFISEWVDLSTRSAPTVFSWSEQPLLPFKPTLFGLGGRRDGEVSLLQSGSVHVFLARWTTDFRNTKNQNGDYVRH